MTNDKSKTAARGLAPFTDASRPGEMYYDEETKQVWRVIGWITQPAAILDNITTGERHVEIVGCPNANRFKRAKDLEAGSMVQ